MGKVIILGSGYAIAEEGHENTHLLIQHGVHCILVDCADSPIIGLKKVGVAFDEVTDLILTHFHPDHVGGVPGFLVESWLLGRKRVLNIYGLAHTIDRLETMMGLYDWKKWPNFFPVIFHRLPDQEMSLAIASDQLKLYSSPVKHLVPTIGLRVEFLAEGKVLAYSCDTEPCPQVIQLAENADILIHEATGRSVGHSSAEQAALAARQSQARSLYLIHYHFSPKLEDQTAMLAEAKKIFPGKIYLAVDGMTLDL
jgi:ribonuclease Z